MNTPENVPLILADEKALDDWFYGKFPSEESCRNALAALVGQIVTRHRVDAIRCAAHEFADGAWAEAFIEHDVEDDESAVQATEAWLNDYAERTYGSLIRSDVQEENR